MYRCRSNISTLWARRCGKQTVLNTCGHLEGRRHFLIWKKYNNRDLHSPTHPTLIYQLFSTIGSKKGKNSCAYRLRERKNLIVYEEISDPEEDDKFCKWPFSPYPYPRKMNLSVIELVSHLVAYSPSHSFILVPWGAALKLNDEVSHALSAPCSVYPGIPAN